MLNLGEYEAADINESEGLSHISVTQCFKKNDQ